MMLDPTAMPDPLPLTGIPTVDAILKLLGALSVIATVLATILPKGWAFTQWIAQHTNAADWRGVQGQAAVAKAMVAGGPPTPRDASRGFVSLPALFVTTSCAIVVVAIASYLVSGCAQAGKDAKTACDAIKIADDACSAFVMVPLPDGTKEQVPRSEITRIALAHRNFRLQGPQ